MKSWWEKNTDSGTKKIGFSSSSNFGHLLAIYPGNFTFFNFFELQCLHLKRNYLLTHLLINFDENQMMTYMQPC